jgi:signal transduction histidine kinase/ActR/RegA family two-component response regulator
MFAAWFDEGFVSEGAQSARLSPMRIALAVVLGALLGWAAGWPAGFAWTATVLVLEIPFFILTSAMVPGRPISRNHAWATFAVYCLTIAAWSLAGAMLWGVGRPPTDIAAAAFFAGHLMYLQTHHSRSLGALIPATPALLAPVATLLIAPHYSGVDQLLLLVTLGAVVGHGAISIGVSYFNAQQLAGANADLKLAKAEADAASQAKSAFLATMSHEIRTPLNGVLGMTQAMAADEAMSSSQRQKLQVIRGSGEALLAILNDILDLSKVEAGKLELETIAFDLVEVARGAHQTFTALAKEKGLSFDLAIAPGATGLYLGDPTRLRQILYNLISNALKFTEAGEIRVALAREDGVLRLTVTDSGVGMEAEHLARLFSKFEQADASTTRRFGGAGLGLSICRELAGLMGGTIEADSRPGEGSAFTVRLPLEHLGESDAGAAAAQSPAGESGESEETDFSQLRVLAAEDNPVNQLVLKTLLAQIGVEPVMAENGAAALAAWEAQDFDLILMDVQMPVMDGPSAARAIRAAETQSGRARTRIIALTANAMSHQVGEYADAGMDGHVAKPIDARRLYAAVADACATRGADLDEPQPARPRAWSA